MLFFFNVHQEKRAHLSKETLDSGNDVADSEFLEDATTPERCNDCGPSHSQDVCPKDSPETHHEPIRKDTLVVSLSFTIYSHYSSCPQEALNQAAIDNQLQVVTPMDIDEGESVISLLLHFIY